MTRWRELAIIDFLKKIARLGAVYQKRLRSGVDWSFSQFGFEIKAKRREAKKSGITAMASLRGGSRAVQVFSVVA